MILVDNFCIYSEPKTKRMLYIPTGLDITTGASIFLKSYMIDGNYSSHPGFKLRPLAKQLFANQELNTFENLHFDMSQSLVNPTVMYPFIDSVIGMIRLDAEWDQSLPRLGSDIGLRSRDNFRNTPGVNSFLPPRFHFGGLSTMLKQTLEESIGDTINFITQQSVKQFITNKSTNVIASYNQSTYTTL